MKQEVTCEWLKDMSFMSDVGGHQIILDADEKFGGKNEGPRPKPLILTALAGCTGMDVISIIKKYRMGPTWFNMVVTAEMTETHPKYYTRIDLTYQFKESDNLNKEKVKRAVELSQEEYCGVAELLRKACELNYSIEYV